MLNTIANITQCFIYLFFFSTLQLDLFVLFCEHEYSKTDYLNTIFISFAVFLETNKVLRDEESINSIEDSTALLLQI